MQGLTVGGPWRARVEPPQRLIQVPACLPGGRRLAPLAPVILPSVSVPVVTLQVSHILGLTARHFGLSMEQIRLEQRRRIFARPRQIATFLARRYTKRSYPELGRILKQDHTTCLHSVQRIQSLLRYDSKVCEDVDQINRQILNLKAIGDCMKAMEVLALEGLQ